MQAVAFPCPSREFNRSGPMANLGKGFATYEQRVPTAESTLRHDSGVSRVNGRTTCLDRGALAHALEHRAGIRTAREPGSPSVSYSASAGRNSGPSRKSPKRCLVGNGPGGIAGVQLREQSLPRILFGRRTGAVGSGGAAASGAAGYPPPIERRRCRRVCRPRGRSQRYRCVLRRVRVSRTGEDLSFRHRRLKKKTRGSTSAATSGGLWATGKKEESPAAGVNVGATKDAGLMTRNAQCLASLPHLALRVSRSHGDDIAGDGSLREDRPKLLGFVVRF
jgi:hypothetical protein